MTPPPVLTNSQGQAIPNPPYATQRIGKHGPLLLQDIDLIDNLAHFDRERIPERVVHGRGSGAHGVFEVTDDITDICAADFLSEVGKKTKTFTRFSLVAAESGANDSARDVRGLLQSFTLLKEFWILFIFTHQRFSLEIHLNLLMLTMFRKETRKLTPRTLMLLGISLR